MTGRDKDGSPYVRLDELRDGQLVRLDGGFTCHCEGWAIVYVHPDGKRPFFCCSEGDHYLDGQDDGDGYCVGVYPVGGSAS